MFTFNPYRKEICMKHVYSFYAGTAFLLFVSVFIVKGHGTAGTDKEIRAIINRTAFGDTAYIPAGTYVFSKCVWVRTGITIEGAGKGKTLFRRADSVEDDFWFFKIDGNNGKPFRMTGESFIGKTPEQSGALYLINGCTDFRIDSCSFKECARNTIQIRGDARGVIDHNTFIDTNIEEYLIGTKFLPKIPRVSIGLEKLDSMTDMGDCICVGECCRYIECVEDVLLRLLLRKMLFRTGFETCSITIYYLVYCGSRCRVGKMTSKRELRTFFHALVAFKHNSTSAGPLTLQ